MYLYLEETDVSWRIILTTENLIMWRFQFQLCPRYVILIGANQHNQVVSFLPRPPKEAPYFPSLLWAEVETTNSFGSSSANCSKNKVDLLSEDSL